MPFVETAALQERLRADLLAGAGPETLLFCEHAPVVTLGRSARPANILASADELARRGVAVAPASRGGDVTYHGPGQLVGYPVVRLRGGVIGHMTAMARAIGRVLAQLGIVTTFRRDAPGLWTNDEKLCAFGVHVRSRVAIHGFALNVTTDLRAFDLIVPCGLRGVRTTSIARRGLTPPPLEALAARIARELGVELGAEFVERAEGGFASPERAGARGAPSERSERMSPDRIDRMPPDRIAMLNGITRMDGA